MGFTVKRTVDNRWFVAGEDANGTFGQTVLASEAWSALQDYNSAMDKAKAKDEAARDFFGPLLERLRAADTTAKKDWAQVVLTPKVEGQDFEGIILDPHGTILRILDETDGSSLYWVGSELIALED